MLAPGSGLGAAYVDANGLPLDGDTLNGIEGGHMPAMLHLLGGMKQARARGGRTEACPGCGMTPAEFRSKGRLGCPRCYETFRQELLPLLQRIHEAQSHSGRLPGTTSTGAPPPDERPLSDVRRLLEDAVRGERYEEAARLRDELGRLERGEVS